MERSQIDRIARETLMNERSHKEREVGWAYRHGDRTAVLALWLRELLFPERVEWDDALYAAAKLHDCAKTSKTDHGKAGAARAGKLLRGVVEAELLPVIQSAILKHNKRGGPSTEMEQLLQDADILDHFGSIEVWLNVSYSVLSGSGPEMSLEFYRTELDKMVEELLPQFNFEPARRVFLERVQYSRQFGERLAVEAAGGVYSNVLNGI